MKYCCLVWAGVPNFYLDMLDERQKWVRRAVGPTLVIVKASLSSSSSLVIASLNIFYRYYFGR